MQQSPFLSVIVPAHRAAHQLEQSLPALLASDLPRDAWELIVVDDASPDETGATAAKYADAVVSLRGAPNGPAYGRNRAAEVSRGECLVFVDADVLVHPDALGRIAEAFARDRELAGLFGSYDNEPGDPGFMSQYRNLLHHYVHQQSGGEADTFWAGLGAIRRSVFAEVGGFDEWHYHRPQIEDIELGRRIRRAGYRIHLDPAIQGKHLKRWTFREILRTDLTHRGVPWMWLILREGSHTTNTLNLRLVERWCTALVNLGLVALVAGFALGTTWPAAFTAGAVTVTVFLNRAFYRYLASIRGWGFAVRAMAVHLLYYVNNGFSVIFGWLVNILLGEPPPRAETAALAQVGVDTWPPAARRPDKSTWSLP